MDHLTVIGLCSPLPEAERHDIIKVHALQKPGCSDSDLGKAILPLLQ